MLLAVVACSQPATTTTSTTSEPTTTAAAAEVSTGDVSGFEVITVDIGGESYLVALADTDQRQSRGLMGISDLGDLSGMLFVFEPPRLVGFWMKDVLIPLDLAFIDEQGQVIEVITMDICDDPCPSYNSSGPVAFALESPAGSLTLQAGDRIVVPPPAG